MGRDIFIGEVASAPVIWGIDEATPGGVSNVRMLGVQYGNSQTPKFDVNHDLPTIGRPSFLLEAESQTGIAVDSVVNSPRELSGNRNVPAGSGSPTWKASVTALGNNPGYHLVAGSSQQYTVTGAALFTPTTFTIAALFAMNATLPAFGGIIASSSSGAWSDGWGITQTTVAGRLNFWVGNYLTKTAPTNAPLSSGSAYLVIASYDGATLSMTLNGDTTTFAAAGATNYVGTPDVEIAHAVSGAFVSMDLWKMAFWSGKVLTVGSTDFTRLSRGWGGPVGISL